MTDGAATYEKPLPKIREIDKPYWEGTKVGELRLQHCLDCDHYWHPPSEICPKCLSENFEWKASSGKGTIWTRVFMHQVYYKAYADEVPYNVVWVRLEEGPLITSNIVGAEKDEIDLDRNVEVLFDPVTDEVTLPRFRLV